MIRKILRKFVSFTLVVGFILGMIGAFKCVFLDPVPPDPANKAMATELVIRWHELEIERLKKELEAR